MSPRRYPASMDGEAAATRASPCCANYLLCKNDHVEPLDEGGCEERNTKWYRIRHLDGRKGGRGNRNRFGGAEWIKPCQAHDYDYEECAQSQDCHRNGCIERRAEVLTNGRQVNLCLRHLGRVHASNDRTPSGTETTGKSKHVSPERSLAS